MSRSILSVSVIACLVLANCSSGGGGGGGSSSGLAGNPAAAKVVGVRNGQISVSLNDTDYGAVSNSVGIVAYGGGVDSDRGQIVTASGYNKWGGVGRTVTSGTVTYDTDYGMQVASNISRSSTTIRSDTVYQDSGNLTLTANYGRGTLTGSDHIVDFDGTISGQDVSGTVDVAYSTNGNTRNATMTTDLDGEIGSNGVIGTFNGVQGESASVSGGFVGTAN